MHEFDPHTPSIARIYDYFLGGEDNSRSIVRWRRVAERQIAIAPLIPVSGALMKKHNALARRLRYRQHDYLRFTQDSRAPPDNNGTERDIRMAKLKQKVSGCLRTMTGVGQFCAIRSYLSTAAKHGLSFLDALAMLTEGEPWMPAAA